MILAISGGSGGLISFLYAVKKGRIRNNHHFRKGLLEIVGGSIVASFMLGLFTEENSSRAVIAIAFLTGACWAQIIEVIRIKITKFVEAALGEKLKSD